MPSNREVLRSLLSENRLTQAECAALLSQQTMRPCSVRTVRSWLNDPSKPSSRLCPDWVIPAFKKAIQSRR